MTDSCRPVRENTQRNYVPHTKHDPQKLWNNASPMDLDNATAQQVLTKAIEIPNKKQLIGLNNGKIYAFQPDNNGGYHGYIISGKELVDKYPQVSKQVA